MEILVAIAGKLAEFTVEPIGRQAGHLAHYKSNHQKLQTKLKELIAVRDGVQHKVDQVERGGKRIEATVLNWKTDVDAIITEAEEFLRDGRHAQTECLHGFCPHLVLRYRLSRKSTKLAEEIDQLYGKIDELDKKKEFSNFAYDVPPQEVCLSSTGHYSAFDSRNSIVMRVMEELRNPNTEMILVWGIGGVGKTTLVEEVLRKAKDDNLFDDVVMVRDVKENPDLEKIQKEIATKLGMSINENHTLAQRAPSLCTRIKEKRTLVVLDDVWEKIDLLAVGLPCLVTCKVVLTCRSRKDLSLDRRTQTEISLDVLNEEEAWSLFEKMAGDVVKDSRIRSVATEVAKKCGGLPLLIVTVARALKDRRGLHHWNFTLRSLGGFDDKELTEKPYLALEWSYNQLEDKELKPLFLLCGIIVVKNHIYLADLLKYGFGLGLIKNVDTIEEARDALNRRVDQLKDSCLLLDSDINMHVRMHDLVCEVATRIASSKHHVLSVGYGGELKEWPEKDFFERCSKMSLKSSNIPMLSEVPWKCPKLEMFHFYREGWGDASVEFPTNFFSEMEKLKVLGLTKVRMLSLFSSLQYLKNLQTLCLEECLLEEEENQEIALVGHLCNLEILSFARSNIKQLPEEIGQLTRLRWLDLSDCDELEVISPNVISRLERLEDLSLRNVFLKWEAERGGSNASLLELKDLSQLTALEIYIEDANILPSNLFSSKLVRYQIYIGGVWKYRWSPEMTMAETTLNTLRLELITSNELDHGIEVLLKRCEDLSLDGTENFKSIARQLDVEDFQQLIHLRLQNNVDFTYIINRKVVFPNLTTLSVSSCDHLRFLFSFSMANSLVVLKHLEVSSCAKMEAIVSTRDQSNGENIGIMFCKLESLTLDDLPNLARFFTESCIDTELGASIFDPTSSKNLDVESGTAVRSCLFDAQVGFPSLEKLKIKGLMKLQTIWNNQLLDQDSFSRLREVNISDCNSLVNVFVPRMMGRLNALETLYILGCDSVEVVFEVEGTDVEETPADTSSSPHHLRPFYCQSLGSVTINSCKSLKKIFPASVARGLQKLNSLDVEDCDEVEEIIVGEQGPETELPQFVFPKVTRVEFSNLPKLSKFYPEIHASKWPLLEQLFVYGCDKVKVFAAELPIFPEKHEPDSLIEHSLFLIDKVVFPNLTTLSVSSCDHLRFLFSFSMAQSLVELKHLEISSCAIMEAIVSTRDQSNEENIGIMFCKLESLTLYDLPNLAVRSCLFDAQVRFPSLEKLKIVGLMKLQTIWNNQLLDQDSFSRLREVNISRCNSLVNVFVPRMMGRLNALETLYISDCDSVEVVFEVQGTDVEETPADTSSSPHQLRPFYCQSLGLVRIRSCKSLKKIFPASVARGLQKLHSLDVKWCDEVEEIIVGEQGPETELPQFVFPKVTHVAFSNLPKLSRFYPGIHASKWPLLERLFVYGCGKVKIFAAELPIFPEKHEPDPLIEQSLFLIDKDSSSPAAISFRNLTTLRVEFCDGLEYLTSYSVAKSLIQLTELYVRGCRSLRAIIGASNEDDHDTGGTCEIAFSRLQHLELEDLPELQGFCSGNCIVKLPSSTELDVRWCPIELKISSEGVLLSKPKPEIADDGEKEKDEDVGTSRQEIEDRQK